MVMYDEHLITRSCISIRRDTVIYNIHNNLVIKSKFNILNIL